MFNLLAVSALGLAALSTASPVDLSERQLAHSRPKALYFADNLSKNSVVSMPIDKSGLPGKAVVTSAGGSGGIFKGLNTSTFVNNDALGSSSNIIIEGNYLYLTNPGSNSVASFAIDPKNPTHLTPIEITKTQGIFPNTLAISHNGKIMCASSASSTNGVECWSRSTDGKLVSDGQGLRGYNVALTHTPPQLNDTTASEIFFSSDDSRLYSVIKRPGHFGVYKVENGIVGKGAVKPSQNGNQLFGGFAIPNSDRIWVSDLFLAGGYIFELDDQANNKNVSFGVPDPFFLGLCWAKYSRWTDSVWVAGPDNDTLVSMDLQTAHLRSQYNIEVDAPEGGLGLINIAVHGKYLYALAPGVGYGTHASVLAVNITQETAPRTIGLVNIGHGVNQNAQGMAVWPQPPQF